MPESMNNARHTNYTSQNPLISYLLNIFLHRVSKLLSSIEANRKFGLDAGCGEGHMLGFLRQQNVVGSMVAVDLDPEYLRYAGQQFLGPFYTTANLTNLPFRNHSFDYILTTEVFEHLPDPVATIQELHRVAVAKAPLIISVPFEPFFHWGNLLRGKYWNRGGRTPDHKHFWHRSAFRRFLEPFVSIETELSFSSFPWLLYACRFK
jgi:SAM-dependent methyltransferase